jgi:GT2 family glycosyltransferase
MTGDASDGRSAPVLPVSHIIPTRDRPAMVVAAVESILAGSSVPAELIVVDQSRTPNPAFEPEAIRAGCTIRYLWSRETGLSRGRNAGIAAASHPVLSFTDDDISVTRDWLEQLVRPLLDGESRTVTVGPVVPGASESDGGFAPSTITDDEPWVIEGRTPRDVLYPNVAIPRAAFDEIGRYDVRLGAGSRFPAAEDNDLGHRLLEAGYRVRYEPRAAVIHRAWRTGGQFVPLRWSYGRGQGAFYAKHGNRPDGYMRRRLGRDVVGHLRRGARHLLRRRLRSALGDLAYAAGILTGAVGWLLSGSRRP